MIRFATFLSFLALLIHPLSSVSQVQCGTQISSMDYIPVNNSGASRDGTPFIIPVIVHIFAVNNTLPVTPGNVHEFIELTNKNFSGILPAIEDVQPEFQSLVSNPNVQLILATKLPDGTCFNGIIYHQISSISELPFDFTSYSIDTEHYLNINVANGMNSGATFPTPGLLAGNPIDYINLNHYDSRLRQITLTHELGHWLGLGHTFGPANVSAVACFDDGIADTPPTKGSALGTCNLTLSECTPEVIENVHNHMDYSDCPMMFTLGQAQQMLNVIADTNLARYQLGLPENLISTGVFDTTFCPGTLITFNDQFPNCDSSLIRLFGTYTNIIADSVSWYCPGATQELWLSDHPQVHYPTEGLKTAYFTVCGQGNCVTSERTFNVSINQGVPSLPFTEFPYSEDFENNFSFPGQHISQNLNDITPWRISDFTGYNSENCAYVPAMSTSVYDTTEFVVGAFDFSTLQNPTITAKIAISRPNNASNCVFSIGIREVCNNLVPSGNYYNKDIGEISLGNTQVNFIPQSNNQWYPVTLTWPNFVNASNAELYFRVNYFPLNPSNTHEAFYIDDIRVGELEVTTKLNKINTPSFSVFPNPIETNFQVNLRDEQIAELQIYSTTGQLLMIRLVNQGEIIDFEKFPAGVYFIKSGNWTQKLLKF